MARLAEDYSRSRTRQTSASGCPVLRLGSGSGQPASDPISDQRSWSKTSRVRLLRSKRHINHEGGIHTWCSGGRAGKASSGRRGPLHHLALRSRPDRHIHIQRRVRPLEWSIGKQEAPSGRALAQAPLQALSSRSHPIWPSVYLLHNSIVPALANVNMAPRRSLAGYDLV